jgi:hypothetical protein
MVAVTADMTTPTIGMYWGNLTTTVAAKSTGTQTNGSGSVTSDAARLFMIGNRDEATPDAPLQGRIGIAMVVNRAMSAAEIAAWQFRPRVVAGTVGYWVLTGSGTQPDLSGNGNNGTITGGSQADNPPLGPIFGFDWRNQTLRFLGVYA